MFVPCVGILGWLAGVAVAEEPSTDVLADQLRTLAGRSPEQWEAEARGLLLKAADGDRSGALEAGELERIGCEAWGALDQQVRARYAGGLARIYGLDDGYLFAGERLGLAAAARAAARGRMQACTATPSLGGPAGRIADLPDAGSDAWDAEVRAVLIGAYDRNGDGLLGGREELGTVPCEVWQTIDAGVVRSWGDGLLGIYGFQTGKSWSGGALGIAEGAREDARGLLAACGLADDLGIGASQQVVDAIKALPGPGTDPWDVGVRALIVAAYDLDGDGWLGGADELTRVPCQVWREIERGVIEGWGAGLYDIYGFQEGESWEGTALGIPAEAREAGSQALVLCRLADDPLTRAPDESGLVEAIAAVPEGGSGPWDDAVRELLLAVHDRDRSGVIDEVSEIVGVGCPVWQAIDTGVRQRWPEGLATVYGFYPTLQWVGRELGITSELREQGLVQLRACGLAASEDIDPQELASEIVRLTGAGSARWNREVSRRLLVAYDRSDDGSLDSAEEVRAVHCDVWRAMDSALLAQTGKSLFDTYGFDPTRTWSGYALGIEGPVRSIAADALLVCLQAPVVPVEPTKGTALEQLAAITAQRATPAWEEAARGVMLANWDRNRSGALEAVEVEAVPCEVWQWLDGAAREGWGAGLPLVLGLGRGMRDARDTLGLAVGGRARMERAITSCLGQGS